MNLSTSMNETRSEAALLLACASVGAGTARRDVIRKLSSATKDWDYVVETSRRHGITALVSSNLDCAARDLVPGEVLNRLRARFQANAGRNLFLTQELLAIVREFQLRGIEVIPFKGPMLAITAYGNLALREFLDLDILVRREHFDRARDALLQLGYRQPESQTGERESSHVESQLGCDFIREDGRASVELHWSFIQKWLGFGVNLDALWNASGRVNVGGVHVSTLPPEIALLYLCAHGSKHRWSRLCWVMDVAQMLGVHPEMRLENLIKTAADMGCQRTLFLGLRLAEVLLGVELPHAVSVKTGHDPVAVALSEKIMDEMFSSKASANQRASLERDVFHLRTKERWRDRLRYLRYLAGWIFAPSQKDKRWILLPGRLQWLYFFLRPVRVACDRVRLHSRNWG